MVQTAAQGQKGHGLDAFPARLRVFLPTPGYVRPGARSLRLRAIVSRMGHLTSVRHTRSCSAAAPHPFLLEHPCATLIAPAHARSTVLHILAADNPGHQAVFHAQCQARLWSPSRHKVSKGWY